MFAMCAGAKMGNLRLHFSLLWFGSCQFIVSRALTSSVVSLCLLLSSYSEMRAIYSRFPHLFIEAALDWFVQATETKSRVFCLHSSLCEIFFPQLVSAISLPQWHIANFYWLQGCKNWAKKALYSIYYLWELPLLWERNQSLPFVYQPNSLWFGSTTNYFVFLWFCANSAIIFLKHSKQLYNKEVLHSPNQKNSLLRDFHKRKAIKL